jgi:hypothetical protein
MLEEYLGAAWQFLDTVKCHLGENYLSYATIEGLPICNVELLPISTSTSPKQPRLVPIDTYYAINT